ncbi:MAG: hypothetical protein ACOCYT_01390 [Chloroflexota bacterium]
MRRLTLTIALLTIAALLLAACGGGDDDPGADALPTRFVAASSTPTPTTAATDTLVAEPTETDAPLTEAPASTATLQETATEQPPTDSDGPPQDPGSAPPEDSADPGPGGPPDDNSSPPDANSTTTEAAPPADTDALPENTVNLTEVTVGETIDFAGSLVIDDANRILLRDATGNTVEITVAPGMVEDLIGSDAQITGTVAALPDDQNPHVTVEVITFNALGAGVPGSSAGPPGSDTGAPPASGDGPPGVTDPGQEDLIAPAAQITELDLPEDAIMLQTYDALAAAVADGLDDYLWVYASGRDDIGWSFGFFQPEIRQTVLYAIRTDGSVEQTFNAPFYTAPPDAEPVAIDRDAITTDSDTVAAQVEAEGLDAETLTFELQPEPLRWQVINLQGEILLTIDATGEAE